MADTTDLADQILDAATDNVRSALVDGLSVQTHSLPDLIAADKHLAAKNSGQSPVLPVRFSKVISKGF